MSFNSFELRTNEGKSYTHAYHTSTISVVNCGGTMDSKGSFIFLFSRTSLGFKDIKS